MRKSQHWTLIMNEKSEGHDAGFAREPGANTRLVLGGRDPKANHGFVNPPVYHASTVLYPTAARSEEHTSELQSHSDLVCRLLLEKKKPMLHGTSAWVFTSCCAQ